MHGHTAIPGSLGEANSRHAPEFDWEHTNNDDTIVRISPRKESRYRVQVAIRRVPGLFWEDR